MPKARKAKSQNNESLEQKLWKAADKLRKNIDAAEYKHIVLGLIFLKYIYISDAFEYLHERLIAGEGEYEGADPEDPDEYKAENVFFALSEARWSALQAQAKQPDIGQRVDEAMEAIDNYLNWRRSQELPVDGDSPLLLSHSRNSYGQRLNYSGVYKTVKAMAVACCL